MANLAAVNETSPRPDHVQQLIDLYGAQTTLEDALTNLRADIQTLGYTYICTKCLTEGKYQKKRDSGDAADTEDIFCSLCGGNEYTDVQKKAVVSDTYTDAT